MTMAEFRAKYGHQASGLRLLIDELIGIARFNPERMSDELANQINEGMQGLQLALMDKNLKDWRLP